MDQVINMTEYGLVAEEMECVLLAAQNGYVLSDEKQSLSLLDTADSTDTYQVCLNTFYAIILHNDQYFVPDKEPSKSAIQCFLSVIIYLNCSCWI